MAIFGLTFGRPQPPTDPQAATVPMRESRGGPLGRACAAALAAIAGAAPARVAAERQERTGFYPLTPQPARPMPGERRLDPMMADRTGGRVGPGAPSGIPSFPKPLG